MNRALGSECVCWEKISEGDMTSLEGAMKSFAVHREREEIHGRDKTKGSSSLHVDQLLMTIIYIRFPIMNKRLTN